MGRLRAWFARLRPAYKALVGLVAPVGTIIATLLALNVIQPVGEDAFAASVDRTTEAATATINLRFASESAEGRASTFAASGGFDYRAGRGRLSYDLSETPGNEALTDVEVRFNRRQVYMKLGAGKRPWIHADLATAEEELADFAERRGLEAPPAELASLADLDFSDPSQVLAELQRASEVEELGEETLFGVATRSYRAVVRPREPGGRRLTATVWIDGRDLIRRLDLESGDGPAPFTMTMEFSAFGKPVDAAPPPAATVTELSEALDLALT